MINPTTISQFKKLIKNSQYSFGVEIINDFNFNNRDSNDGFYLMLIKLML